MAPPAQRPPEPVPPGPPVRSGLEWRRPFQERRPEPGPFRWRILPVLPVPPAQSPRPASVPPGSAERGSAGECAACFPPTIDRVLQLVQLHQRPDVHAVTAGDLGRVVALRDRVNPGLRQAQDVAGIDRVRGFRAVDLDERPRRHPVRFGNFGIGVASLDDHGSGRDFLAGRARPGRFLAIRTGLVGYDGRRRRVPSACGEEEGRQTKGKTPANHD